MTFFPRRWWAEMTTKEFRDLDPRTIAILPVAAVEQHGPHLPVMVDARINRGVHERIVELLPADLPVTVLPMLPVGKSIEHVNFPGTLTTTATTLQALWTDVGLSVARAGIQKLVILNSHGGQPQVMEIVARELRLRAGMFVVGLSWWGVGKPEGLFPKAEFIHGIHGGSTETSIMMHLEPGLVNEAERADFASATIAMEAEYKHLHAEGFGVGFGWITEDLHPSGALGNALDADAARGKLLVDHAANGIIDLLKDMHAFTPPFALKKPGYLG
jgi:creatinine amidohydrolase